MSPKPGPDREATDERILRAIRDAYAPAVGTSEIAEELDVQRQTADRHLRSIADEGFVNTKKIGRVRVWWLSDKGRKLLAEG
jgi:DNA-binding MarR family transcriptional regulator